MEIRDVVHGVIPIDSHEIPILDSFVFQRLRQIKQTGFAEQSYPGATHNRYSHSVGAMFTATEAFLSIFKNLETRSPETFLRLRAMVRLAALLHDVGHGPLSHTTEYAMPDVCFVDPKNTSDRKATHEDYTLKIILDSPLTPVLEKAGVQFGFEPIHIAGLIESSIQMNEDVFKETIDGVSVNFRPILRQLISSELDADRMDYLRRDSYYCGVNYGVFDYSWLERNLMAHVQNGQAYLAFQHRALFAFEDFLLARFNMFMQVYLHHKTVIYDEMLARYLSSENCEYRLPSDIEQYIQSTDAQLYSAMSHSKNEWARRIIEKRPLKMLLETHSGIPSTENAREQQEQLFIQTCQRLDENNVHYIATKSTGFLSKYFGKSESPIFVRYDNLLSEPSYIPVHKCTSLFTKYPNSRTISRIFVTPEEQILFSKHGRSKALLFD